MYCIWKNFVWGLLAWNTADFSSRYQNFLRTFFRCWERNVLVLDPSWCFMFFWTFWDSFQHREPPWSNSLSFKEDSLNCSSDKIFLLNPKETKFRWLFHYFLLWALFQKLLCRKIFFSPILYQLHEKIIDDLLANRKVV